MADHGTKSSGHRPAEHRLNKSCGSGLADSFSEKQRGELQECGITEDEKDEAKDDQDPACNGYRFICCLEGTLSIARNG